MGGEAVCPGEAEVAAVVFWRCRTRLLRSWQRFTDAGEVCWVSIISSASP